LIARRSSKHFQRARAPGSALKLYEPPSAVIVNGKRLTQAEYAAWSRERLAFLDECDAGLDAMLRDQDCRIKTMTDDDFWRGRFERQANDKGIQKYRRMAEAQGFSTTGKVWMPSLARYPGDPEAFVSNRGDVLKVCRKRRISCDGEVNYKATPTDEDLAPLPEVKLAPDIVEQHVNQELKKEPSLKLKRRQELREMVTEKYGAPERKKKSGRNPFVPH
jgi:hypothetical protein